MSQQSAENKIRGWIEDGSLRVIMDNYGIVRDTFASKSISHQLMALGIKLQVCIGPGMEDIFKGYNVADYPNRLNRPDLSNVLGGPERMQKIFTSEGLGVQQLPELSPYAFAIYSEEIDSAMKAGSRAKWQKSEAKSDFPDFKALR